MGFSSLSINALLCLRCDVLTVECVMASQCLAGLLDECLTPASCHVLDVSLSQHYLLLNYLLPHMYESNWLQVSSILSLTQPDGEARKVTKVPKEWK